MLIQITAVSEYKGRQGRWLEFARFVVVAPVRQVMYSLSLRGLADRVFVLFVTSSDVACRLKVQSASVVFKRGRLLWFCVRCNYVYGIVVR